MSGGGGPIGPNNKHDKRRYVGVLVDGTTYNWLGWVTSDRCIRQHQRRLQTMNTTNWCHSYPSPIRRNLSGQMGGGSQEMFSRGGVANFGFISITYHQYIFGLYKYILRLEISIFDRENNKNRQELRIIICFRDIQSGRGTTTNVGFQEIFSLSNILISPNDILIIPYDLLK